MEPIRRLFRGAGGQLTETERQAVLAERPMLMAQGLRGWVNARHYRGPDLRTGRGHTSASMLKQYVRGAIAITPTRILVRAGGMKHIDIPPDHPMRAGIQVTQDGPDWIAFRYDAGALNPQLAGQVEVRLRTPEAARIATLLNPP